MSRAMGHSSTEFISNLGVLHAKRLRCFTACKCTFEKFCAESTDRWYKQTRYMIHICPRQLREFRDQPRQDEAAPARSAALNVLFVRENPAGAACTICCKASSLHSSCSKGPQRMRRSGARGCACRQSLSHDRRKDESRCIFL